MEIRSSVFFETVPLGTHSPARRARPAWTPPNGAYQVELRAPADIGPELAAWQALANRAMEPALFADPDILLPALQHLAEGRQPNLLLVWQPTDSGRLLRGLFPVLMPRLRIVPGEVRLWRPSGFPLAPALVDRDHGGAVLDAVFSFCASRGGRCSSFIFAGVAADGALAAAVGAGRRRSEALPLPGLRATRVPAEAQAERPTVKGAQLPGRAAHARAGAQVRDAVESFLVVDAADAKVRGRMALIEDAGIAIRTMTRQLARRGQCRVEALRANGETVAAAIVLHGTDAVWLWRSAGRDGELDLLIGAITAEAGRAGKRLIIANEVRVAPEIAAALEPLAVADLLVSTRMGLSPSAAVTRLKTRCAPRRAAGFSA